LGGVACWLHTLDLSYNGVGDEGARARAGAVGSEACSLHTLDLRYNGVGDEGARALAEALRTGPCTLQTITLDPGYTFVRDVLFTRRRVRLHGLLRAVVLWLSPARRRAAERAFHPDALDFGLTADATAPRPRRGGGAM